jgi:hypothetical protein
VRGRCPRPYVRHEPEQWEQALERWQDALGGRFFPSDPVELLDKLRGECDNHVVVCSQTAWWRPTSTSRRNWPATRGVDSLARHGESRGYEWARPLTVRVTAAAHLPNGRYRVACRAMPHVRDAFPSASE